MDPEGRQPGKSSGRWAAELKTTGTGQLGNVYELVWWLCGMWYRLGISVHAQNYPPHLHGHAHLTHNRKQASNPPIHRLGPPPPLRQRQHLGCGLCILSDGAGAEINGSPSPHDSSAGPAKTLRSLGATCLVAEEAEAA